METVLVTGGAGFIGSHLCAKLLAENYAVICLDNLLTGAKSNIEPLLENPHFTFLLHDISQPLTDIKDKLIDINYIYHLASPASPNKKSKRSYISLPVETMMANSQGTYYLLQLAKEKGAKFLFTSTSEVYGNPQVSPQPETYFGNVNPNGIRSVYDEAKRFGEAMTFGMGRLYDLDVRIVRVFNTYGPHMQVDDGRVISNFINQAIRHEPLTIYGDGSQTRSCCYVEDMVEGFLKAMFTENTKMDVFNLGNPDERTIKEIAELIKSLTNSNSEIVYEDLPEDDPLKRKPDITKSSDRLHFLPAITLEDGLKKTIEYFVSIKT
jgi:dTDP-glucose 4,6-dehydratase/UDP-glucuronate decarboxylase